MSSIAVITMEKGERKEYSAENWFVASRDPLYIGIITKPAPGMWEYLSRTRQIVMEVDGKSHDFEIPYRIEVGESTIFFATPSGGSSIPEL